MKACMCYIGLSLIIASFAEAQMDGAKRKTVQSPQRETSSAGANSDSRILNFDADVIEGERASPSIMVQMELEAPTLDTLVFKRNNFNDFHAIDRKRKPKYRGQKSQ